MKRKYIYIIIWTALIFYASLTSSNNIPKVKLIPHIDKVVHFCMYFGQSFLFVPLFSKMKNRLAKYFLVFFISAVFGTALEFMQYYFTLTRGCDFYDGLADAAGALLGCVFYRLFFESKKIEKIVFKV